MFYTPGWSAVLPVVSALGGVLITQAVNSAISWRTRRRDRNERILDAVSELIASCNAWVYATSTQEQDLLLAVGTSVPDEELMETLKSARTVLYAAELEYGRALARVRLTCPPKVVAAAEELFDAVMDFEKVTRAKGAVVLKTRITDGVGTDPDGVVAPQDRLVKATRKVTG